MNQPVESSQLHFSAPHVSVFPSSVSSCFSTCSLSGSACPLLSSAWWTRRPSAWWAPVYTMFTKVTNSLVTKVIFSKFNLAWIDRRSRKPSQQNDVFGMVGLSGKCPSYQYYRHIGLHLSPPILNSRTLKDAFFCIDREKAVKIFIYIFIYLKSMTKGHKGHLYCQKYTKIHRIHNTN